MREKSQKLLLDIGTDLFSGFLLAAATYCFAIPAAFPMTGVSGMALILYHLFHLPIGIMTIVLNIPIAIACYRTLGRKFYINSLKTTVITSLVIDILGPRLPQYQGEYLLAAVSAGVLLGIGYAIVFMRNSSTGGFDFIMMAVKYYRPHLSLGKIAFAMDTVIIAAGGMLFGSVDSVLYGLILNYIYSTVLDKVISGTNTGKLTLIITERPNEIYDEINRTTDRGATFLKATGAYSGEEKKVVMCASSSKEMYQLRKRIHEIDEKAFIIVMESNEVIGEGFREPGDTNLI